MRSITVLLVLLVLIGSCALVLSQQLTACQGTVSGSGKSAKYDLTGLYNALKGAVQTCTDDKRNTYYYIPCRTISQSEPNCAGFAYDSIPAICQKDGRAPPGWHGLGSINATQFQLRSNGDATSGFLLRWTAGGEPSPPPARTTDIEFICDPSGSEGVFTPAENAETPTHDYHLQWTTKFACPTSDGDGDGGDGGDGGGSKLSGGWIFIIILIGSAFIYLVAGVAVKKFVFHAEGIELIPNAMFWIALPGLVKDGNLFVIHKILGLCGRGSYSQV